MIDLTQKEFNKAPVIIKVLQVLAATKQPIGMGTYEKAMREHPEYFVDEIEHKKKWNLIPESVHDAHDKEWIVLQNKVTGEYPNSKGLLYWLDHPKEMDGNYKACEGVRNRYKPQFKELHDKYYAKYDIEFNG